MPLNFTYMGVFGVLVLLNECTQAEDLPRDGKRMLRQTKGANPRSRQGQKHVESQARPNLSLDRRPHGVGAYKEGVVKWRSP